MVQELEILVDHSIGQDGTRLLFSYREEDVGPTKCFYLPITRNALQHRTHVDEEIVIELMSFLSNYINRLKNSKFDAERGISAPVDLNPSRE